MDLVDNSSHMCLICNQTVIGLYNYVEHFKSHATAQESKVFEDKFPAERAKPYSEGPRSSEGKNKTVGKPSTNGEPASGGSSPLCELPVEFADPDMETGAALDQNNQCPDFFQSLELKSTGTSEETPSKARMKAVQRLSILEDDAQAELLLPITTILSNLDFSSDDDFFGLSDDNDGDDNFWLNDDGESESHPPAGHTGGKWKPGEGPKRRMPIAGKWRPGQKPGPACRKNILRKPAKVKGTKADVGKSFYCNVCHSFFMDRNVYSLHFGQSRHQEMVAAKKQESAAQSSFDEGAECVEKRAGELNRIDSRNQQAQHEAAASAKTKDDFYCQDCKLYFNNAVVFATHCETKLHKDAVLKQGFREIKGGDGAVFRINVNTDTVHKEMQETLYPALDSNKDNADKQQQEVKAKSAEPETHECPICVKHFTRKYEMARHLLTRMHAARARHHPEAASIEMLERYNKYMVRLMPFQCAVCSFYFNRQKDFLDHMGSTGHLQTCEDMLGPILCVPCKFKTHKHDEMMEHLQHTDHYAAVEKHHGICVVKESHTRITCKFCGLRMHSAVRMKQHCVRKHQDRMSHLQLSLDVRPLEQSLHRCPLCEKSFKAKSLLQLHFLKVHKHKYLFNCTVCKRGFLDQRRLDNHLRTRFHAKRVVASKIQESKGGASTKNPVVGSLARGKKGKAGSKHMATEKTATDQRRSGRKRKIVRFFDSDDDGDKGQPTNATKSIKSPKKSKMAAVSEVKQTRKTKKSRQVDVNGNAANNKVQSCKVVTGMQSGLKKDSERLSETDQDIETLEDDVQHLSQAKLEAVSPQEEEDDEDEDVILEEEAEEDEGEVVAGDEDEVEKEEHARVNEASLTIFSCTYCEFAATDLLELRAHYSASHPQEILTCQPCDQYFLSLKAYKIHCSGRGHQLKLREMTGETTIHKCRLCDKRFLQEFSCKLHLETVHRHPSSEEDLRRMHKGQDLVTQLYGEHIKQVETLNNETSVSCPECGKFVRKDTLVEHLRLHTGERPYACRFCGRGFAGRLTLRRHLSGHLNMPLFICDLCGKGFKRNGLLQRHIRQHEHERRGERHTCQVCKAWFYTPEELERHSRRHGDRTFHCTWPGCNWSFILAGELKSHMFTHTQEKRFLCDQCGFGAPTKTRLRRHAKSHLKTRAFVCEYCPYKASCKTHLRRHMRIHINSRPFQCPYCKYTCNTHENMRKHILRTQKHKGKKLYPCHLCNKYGSDSSREFKAHLMTEHADYLKENAVDSLAVFSGLYKREEDFQKPKEGSEIIQVTKGRFFKNYQNPGSAAFTARTKKSKAKSAPSLTAIKKEGLKVKIVPPEEIHRAFEAPSKPEGQHQLPQESQHISQQQQQMLDQDIQQEHQQHHQQLQYQTQLQTHPESELESLRSTMDAPLQYTEVATVVQQPYTPHSHVIQTTTFPSTVPVAHHQHTQPHQYHKQPQQQQQQPVEIVIDTGNTSCWNLEGDKINHHHHQQQQQNSHLHTAMSQQQGQRNHFHYMQHHLLQAPKGAVPANKTTLNSSAGSRDIPSPEPWYSGMPQVHAPSTQELQQSYTTGLKPSAPTISNNSSASTSSTFLPDADFLQHIPPANQSQQSEPMPQPIQTIPGQIYTISVADNVRIISEVSRPEGTIVLNTQEKPVYFSG